MISAAILIALWILVIEYSFIKKRLERKAEGPLFWAFSFLIALSILYLIAFLQINTLPDLWWNQFAIKAELILACIYIAYQGLNGKLSGCLLTSFKGKGKSTNILIAIVTTFLIIFSLTTSAPLNWDSNAYNLARVPTMLSEGSTVLLPSTASARQAIFPLAHDLVFYPDLAVGNLRGLPLINTFEFIVMWCTILTMTEIIMQKIAQSNPGFQWGYLYSLASLISSTLLLNGNLQVMQAVHTKNDLIITLLFSLNIAFCLLGLNVKNNTPEKTAEISFALIFLSCLSISTKAYGVIALVPAIIFFVILKLRGQFIATVLSIRKLLRKKDSNFWKIILLGCILLLATHWLQNNAIQSAWSGEIARVKGITNDWTNTDGLLHERLSNAFINGQRFILQGALFPFTAMKPYMPIGNDITPFITNKWIPDWLQGGTASAGQRFSFNLLFGTNHDMAYPFLIFQIGGLIGLIGWILKCPKKGLLYPFVVSASCVVAFCLFAFAVLYQPWISRFLGPTYIPLIPVASVGILLLAKNKQQPAHAKVLKFLLIAGGILPLISSLSLSGYISSAAGIPQDSKEFYRQYLKTQTKLTDDYIPQYIQQLQQESYKMRYLCSSDGPWTLTPMLLSQTNPSFKRTNLKLLNKEACKRKISA